MFYKLAVQIVIAIHGFPYVFHPGSEALYRVPSIVAGGELLKSESSWQYQNVTCFIAYTGSHNKSECKARALQSLGLNSAITYTRDYRQVALAA